MSSILLLALASTLVASPRPAVREPPTERSQLLTRSDLLVRDGEAVDGQTVTAAEPERRLRLAILPDRTTGRAWGMPYLHTAIADLRRIRPDAVFTVGDMVQGYTRDVARWDAETDEWLAAVRPLEVDLYPTAGNHEVISGTRDPADRTFVERYRQRFGPLWYAVEFELATVLVLFSDDAMSDGTVRIGDEQLAWLTTALERAAARRRPILLLMHRPLWRYPSAAWDLRVRPLLEAAGADAVIAGHFHSLQRDGDAGGIQHHIVATCGGMIDQHPFAGQLQHLTFVDIDADGEVSVWHQPVGMTLPDDFVVRTDQDRVFRLTSDASVVRWEGALADPWPSGSSGTVALAVRNPLDVPITFEVTVLDEPPSPSMVGDLPWLSRTLGDAWNPFVAATPRAERSSGAGPVTVVPGASATIPLRLDTPPAAAPPAPVEVRVTATFTDSKGRQVPVWLRRTVPLERTIPLVTAAIDAPVFPIAVWTPSPFDTLEANSTLRVTMPDAGPGAAALTLELTIPDDDRAGDGLVPSEPSRRTTDPLADAMRILWIPAVGEGQASTTREFFIEPFGADPSLYERITDTLQPVPGSTVRVETGSVKALVRVVIPASAGPFPGGRLNVGVADNDHTYHTQWRWLAPPDQPARLASPP